MQIAKWIIAGVVGNLIGSSVWVAVEYLGGHDANWLSLLAGLLTGLAVRSMSGPNQHRFLPGAISVVVTMVGILVSVGVLSTIVTSKSKPVPTLNIDKVIASSKPAGSNEIIEEPDELDEGPSKLYSDVEPSSLSTKTTIYYGIAALLAYVLGSAQRRRPMRDPSPQDPLTESDAVEGDMDEG